MAVRVNGQIYKSEEQKPQIARLELKYKPVSKEDELIEVKEYGLEVLLHPKYPVKIKTILGRVYSLNTLMLCLNREGMLNKLHKPVREHEVYKAKKINVPYYWKIVSLVTTDRLLVSKKLIKKIVDFVKENDKFNIYVYEYVKKGLVERFVLSDRYSTFTKVLRYRMLDVYEIFKDVENIEELDKDKFKELKLQVKERAFNKVTEKLDGYLLEGISDKQYPLEVIKERYLV